MHGLLVLPCAVVLAAAPAASPAAWAGPPSRTELTVSLANTVTDPAGARIWFDGGGKEHVRHLPVHDELVDASGATVGSMDRHVNFNLLPDGRSRAWCDLELTLDAYGSFDGHCEGTLAAGRFVGHGGHRSAVSGVYVLEAGGTPGVGPYDLEMTIVAH